MTGAPAIVPARKISGASAVLMTVNENGSISWSEFEQHLERTVQAGLTPAVNMDTGFGPYLSAAERSQVLTLTKSFGVKFIGGVQVQNGGGFGGKEDITVQGHASLLAYLLKKPVKVHLTREESIIMHPNRPPVWMNITLACDKNGKFKAIKLNAVGDTGAYASVGTKVMERVVGHATGGYTIPSVDIKAVTVYTNNIPSGAMRGFGVPQVVFAIESCIDELCRM